MKNDISIYSLNISDKFENEILIRREQKNIYQMLKRLKNSSTLYKNISFIIGISNVESKTCKVEYIYNKSRGKPSKIIVGKYIKWHFHIYIIGNKISSSSSFCNKTRQHLTRKKGFKTSQNKNNNVENALNYVNSQCISVWKYGDYFHSHN